MTRDAERISTRSLLGAFFLVVLLCAVFFSLGYFMGYKERGPTGAPVAEQVTAPPDSDVPPQTNPAPDAPSASGASTGEAAAAPAASAQADRTPAVAPSSQAAGTIPTPSPAAPAPASAVPGGGSTGVVAPAAPRPRPAPHGVLIQAAALANQQDAANMVSVLTSRGYPALILTPQQARADDNLFRVVVGPYKTRAAAEAARHKLAAEGFKPFIRQ
ncbi:MAG TPA: SPOR domain-containing protein [Terriglobia bacterium]|nr:SPOR domain-containing protein [Terriglobia bacterium]